MPTSTGMNSNPNGSRVSSAHVVEPIKWLRVEDAVRTRGIGRSLLYELITAGRVKSACLRKPGNIRGIRLISAESLDALIESMAEQEAAQG